MTCLPHRGGSGVGPVGGVRGRTWPSSCRPTPPIVSGAAVGVDPSRLAALRSMGPDGPAEITRLADAMRTIPSVEVPLPPTQHKLRRRTAGIEGGEQSR